MAHSQLDTTTHYEWAKAKSLLPSKAHCERGLKGALIPDARGETDHIAVVYDEGEAPPEITINKVSVSVHTVLANGVAVAVIASANGKAPNVSDVLLVERWVLS
ncbi:hypothetical protein [Sulfitobacter sp.]|uniref:hypothetical protein n=1 Tax=Sulfitobacter sp. TaxID=1903071 RepID=UPI0030024A41